MLTHEETLKRVRKAPRIPAPSQIVSKILTLSRDPDCNISAVADLIQRDGSLTAQLLRQANSALYANAKATSSVRDACMRLGLKRVRSVAINDHVVSGLGKACPPGFNANRYWQAALATSVAARDIAGEVVPAQADEAGTAGLLVDVGVGLLAYAIPTEYQAVLKQMGEAVCSDYRTLERQIIGTTHCEIGEAVLADWKLDQHIAEAVLGHHNLPETKNQSNNAVVEGSNPLTLVVAAAVTCSHIALHGPEMDIVDRLFGQLAPLCDQPDDLVSRLLDQLVSHVQQTAQDLAVEIGTTDEMADNFAKTINSIPDVSNALTCRSMDRALFNT